MRNKIYEKISLLFGSVAALAWELQVSRSAIYKALNDESEVSQNLKKLIAKKIAAAERGSTQIVSEKDFRRKIRACKNGSEEEWQLPWWPHLRTSTGCSLPLSSILVSASSPASPVNNNTLLP